MNYIKTIDAIGETMTKGGASLTGNQKALLVGCLAVWLEHAFNEGKKVSSSKPSDYELPDDEEIKHVAHDEDRQDWDELHYATIYADGFVDGAMWMRGKAINAP